MHDIMSQRGSACDPSSLSTTGAQIRGVEREIARRLAARLSKRERADLASRIQARRRALRELRGPRNEAIAAREHAARAVREATGSGEATADVVVEARRVHSAALARLTAVEDTAETGRGELVALIKALHFHVTAM